MVWRDFPSTQPTQQLGRSFYMEDKTIGPDFKESWNQNLPTLNPDLNHQPKGYSGMQCS